MVPKYSIVVPFHNEEENVTTLYDRLKAVMEQVGESFELVFVDDGYVTTIEGYTYGDQWPDPVELIELYELEPGMELMTPPKELRSFKPVWKSGPRWFCRPPEATK